MPNWPGIRAALALCHRPALALPHLVVPSIAHINWAALKAAGVRALVFDKDNCIARPHAFGVEPSLRPAFANAVATFGPAHILIVSNSAGAATDYAGLRAERLSRSLGGVPVLCHPQKKPGAKCARMVIDHFEQVQNGTARLSLGGAEEEDNQPADSSQAGTTSASTMIQRWWLKKAKGRPLDGAIAVIGDRTLTDVVLAHRIGDQLLHRRGRGSGCRGPSALLWNPLSSSCSRSAPEEAASTLTTVGVANLLMAQAPAHAQATALERSASSDATDGQAIRPIPAPGIAILTSAVIEREGVVNDLMRAFERWLVRTLQKRGYEPGQRGWRPTGPRDGALAEAASKAVTIQDLPSTQPSERRSFWSKNWSITGFIEEYKHIGTRPPLRSYQVRHLSSSAKPAPRLRTRPVQASPSSAGQNASGPAGPDAKPKPQWNKTRLIGAALGFFVVVPSGVYFGAWLKERNERAELAKLVEEKENGGVGSESRGAEAEVARVSEADALEAELRQAKLKRLHEIKTETYLLNKQRQDVEDKIARLRERTQSP